MKRCLLGSEVQGKGITMQHLTPTVLENCPLQLSTNENVNRCTYPGKYRDTTSPQAAAQERAPDGYLNEYFSKCSLWKWTEPLSHPEPLSQQSATATTSQCTHVLLGLEKLSRRLIQEYSQGRKDHVETVCYRLPLSAKLEAYLLIGMDHKTSRILILLCFILWHWRLHPRFCVC